MISEAGDWGAAPGWTPHASIGAAGVAHDGEAAVLRSGDLEVYVFPDGRVGVFGGDDRRRPVRLGRVAVGLA